LAAYTPIQNYSGLPQKCRTQACTSTCAVDRSHPPPLATKGFFGKCRKPGESPSAARPHAAQILGTCGSASYRPAMAYTNVPSCRRHASSGRRPSASARRLPRPDRRRALAASHDGATEALMLAHGFTVERMVELVRAGLASATAERVVAGSRKMELATVRITEAGRRALAGR